MVYSIWKINFSNLVPTWACLERKLLRGGGFCLYFLHLSTHVIRRLDWLCGCIPGFSHLHLLEAVSCWRTGTELGGKINSFFRLTETGFKTTSALRRPHASLNYHKHFQVWPSSALQAGPWRWSTARRQAARCSAGIRKESARYIPRCSSFSWDVSLNLIAKDAEGGIRRQQRKGPGLQAALKGLKGYGSAGEAPTSQA